MTTSVDEPPQVSPFITDEDFVSWVAMGLPEHERASIYSVPIATLKTLYPTVRRYGPNADSVEKFIQDLPVSTKSRRARQVGDKHRDIIRFLPFELGNGIAHDVHDHIRPGNFRWDYHQTATVAAELIAADGFNPGTFTQQNSEAVRELSEVVNLDMLSYQFTVVS